MLRMPLGELSVPDSSTRIARSKNSINRDVSREFSSFRVPRSDVNRAIEEYFISLGTPVALSCLILFRHGEHLQLAQKELHPIHYNSSELFADDFAAVSFLRKAPFLNTGLDLKAEAMLSFSKSEEECKVTNRRFRNLSLDQSYSGSSALLHEATRRKVRDILGNFDFGKTFDMGSWGPGVTRSVKGSDVSASRKFREERGITSLAYRLIVPAARSYFPQWFTDEFISQLQLLEGNEVITVPKNSKTDRTIGIEPGLNSYFQLGIGRSIRLRLRKAGFDLNSDLKNRSGALTGSIDNSLATVDFSSASDTISREVVRTLLPEDWFFALDSLRSPCYNLNGELIPYAKFSAMGNGFTFELESLIFVAAAITVCESLNLPCEDISVFGDDIIIPVQAMERYSDFCKFLGFTVNPRKSFSSTGFRESCGSYFFLGKDVKPLFLKEVISNAKSIYRLANSIRLLSHRRCINGGCDSKFRPVWRYVVRRLPSALRAYGPLSAGDACISVNFDEATPKLAKYGWEGSLHPGYIERAIRVIDEQPSLMLAKLRYFSNGLLDNIINFDKIKSGRGELLSESFGNEIPLRSVTRIVFKKSMFAPQWYNFGAWN